MQRPRLEALREQYAAGLADTVAFWRRHSVDRECGGFFMCLDRDGSVYGTDKPVWLQGRAVWLYATLYRVLEARPEYLELARHGYDFLMRHCFDERGKMYFLVARDGRPLQMRRYVYSEVFGTLACAALAKATGDEPVRRRAGEIFESFVRHIRTPGLIAPKFDPQTRPMRGLSPLMCLLNMADTLLLVADRDGSPDRPLAAAYYERLIDEAIADLFAFHVKADDACVLETVGPRGERIDEPQGRLMNPGHAIEAAWFILEIARRRNDQALVRRTLPVLDWSFERGWDREHGGLLYFIDVAGKPSLHLEHDMKLWWPHCEALYAYLLAWHLTREERYARRYEQIHEWTFAHFPDPQNGEWFGYLRRDGSVALPLKGGYWKGPFHVPRAQLCCLKLLEELLAGQAGA